MTKNVLVISSSLRKGSNSEALADMFIRGAAEAGHKTEKITLDGKQIGFCKGCLACQKTLKCVINDDSRAITEKMLQADIIAFATPVYYYGMSGQLKTVLDRANPLFSSDYKFKEIYLLAAAAEDAKTTVSGTVTGIQGWVDCFGKAEFKKTIFAGGVNSTGDIAGHKALNEAYEVGLKL